MPLTSGLTSRTAVKGEGHIHSDKWHRCIEHVKANSPGYEPHAVCTNALGYKESVNPEHRTPGPHASANTRRFKEAAKRRAEAKKVDFRTALKWEDEAHPREENGRFIRVTVGAQKKTKHGAYGKLLGTVDVDVPEPADYDANPGMHRVESAATALAAPLLAKALPGLKITTSMVGLERFTKKWDEGQHPRDKEGQFTEAGGGGGTTLSPAQQAMQDSLAAQAKKPVHTVKSAEEAVALVLKGENVEITDVKDVHTMLAKLGQMAIEAKAKGEKAPNFDPCHVTVKGVSLFCTDTIKTKEFPNGIPRIEMPQFKSNSPTPGSEADAMPRDKWGEVDATQAFLDHLSKAGVKTNPNGHILARKLKASQAEMEGAKVAALMLHPERDPKKAKITVTSDGYVVDGHHTWAAAIGRDAEDGNLDNDKKMDVVVIDMPMSKVYHAAVEWTRAFGLPAQGVKKREIRVITIKSEDAQLVFGEVYAPNRPDAQGEYMTAPHIQKMAHEFIRSGKMGQIDLMHGNKIVSGASVVESFVADDADTRFLPGSWVIGVHIPDPTLWAAIKKGEINGFSMEALVTRHEHEVDVDIPPVVTGLTSKHEDHHHKFFVTYDPTGQFKGGVTDMVNGHSHQIVAGTHTQDADGHRHRFSSVDNVQIVE